ncbi:MAG: phage major capsid domain-containing protein, partial [Candidatus Fonsibacter sp.]
MHSHAEDHDRNVPNGTYACNYGVTDALAPYPLHRLVNMKSATINKNTVSFFVQ